MKRTIALAMAAALTGAVLSTTGASASDPLDCGVRVQLVMQWGDRQQAATTICMAALPRTGESVSAVESPLFPEELQRIWRVWKVLHTPGAPYQDAMVFVRPARHRG